MAVTGKIPGMQPGATLRNILVGLLYLSLWPLLILFYIPFAIATNRHNLSDRLAASPLARIPTIENGGMQSAITVFLGIVLIAGIIGAVAPADDPGGDVDSETDIPSDGQTDTETSDSDSGSESPTGDDTETTSDDSTDDSSGSPTGDSDGGEAGQQEDTTGDETETAGDGSTDDGTGTPDDDSTDNGESSTDGTNEQGSSSQEGTSDDGSESETTTTELTVEVVDVVDGDTIDIQYDNGSTDTVRLLGIDTPEVHTDVSPDEFSGVPDSEAGRQCLRDYGERASAYVKDELNGETVEIRFDDAADRRGVFDRLLAYVYVDSENFNYVLVASGYARVFQSRFSQSARFYAAESDAQDAETGLWECRSVDSGSDEEQTDDTQLVVADIRADAPDNDHENLNGEYIVFRNDGDEPLDITGWKVRDEVDHTYRFPTGFTLAPGDEVTLYTGSGSNTDSELYWGSGRAIWNNGGDTIFVYDENGAVVIERSYG